MQRTLVLGSIGVLLFVAAASAEQATCYPRDVSMWTGTVQIGTGTPPSYTKMDGNVVSYNVRNQNGRDGWIQFDIGVLPKVATITAAELHYYLSAAPLSATTYWVNLEDEPASVNAAQINANFSGPRVTADYSSSTIGWHTVPLTDLSWLQTAVTYELGWYAIGWYIAESRPHTAHGHASTNAPYLVVTYTATGTKEAPQAERPATHTLCSGIAMGSLRLFERSAALRDIHGRKVMNLVSGTNDISRLSTGVYFVISDGFVQPVKVIGQRSEP